MKFIDDLFCSFYVHQSVFKFAEVNTSWRLDASTYIDPAIYPLPSLFKLLEMKPYQNVINLYTSIHFYFLVSMLDF